MDTTYELDEKVALVTGASQGIGEVIARRLAAQGAAVIVGYATDPDRVRGEAVAKTIADEGGTASAVACDITDIPQIEALFTACISRYGRPDIVVSNAGVATLVPLSEVTEAEFDRVFAVNAKGTLMVLRSAARELNDGGAIVHIGSSSTMFPVSGAAIYAASKATINEYTKVAALELAQRGIRVNTVLPGITQTPLLSGLPPELRDMILRDTPLAKGQLGQPADIADVVAFLVSPQARWITGQQLLVNGGSNH